MRLPNLVDGFLVPTEGEWLGRNTLVFERLTGFSLRRWVPDVVTAPCAAVQRRDLGQVMSGVRHIGSVFFPKDLVKGPFLKALGLSS